MMKKRLFYLLMLLLTMVTQGAWAMGELTGIFSVSESKEVCFSKGNLQAVIESGPTDGYNYTASKWKFAEHQWDYVGNNSGNSTFAAGTTVDLFGWVGESASYDTYGLCTLDHSQDEYFGNVANESLKSDWGKKMGDGWHTPTHEEWDYLFNTRPASTVGGTENGRYAMATVNSVSGVILFPDSYTHPGGVTAPASVNNPSASFNSNNYAGDNWDKMEAAGAVFLPFAGFRDNYYNTPFRASESYYWSSSAYNSFSVSDAVYILTFSPNFLSADSHASRSIGCSVRLVKNAPLQTDDEGAYLISNANEWYTFCADVNTGTTYAGKTVKLTADISGATHMAGTVDNPFAGTFDGQYHTLNVDITSSGTAAPFVRVGNATIRNLHVTGSVRTTMSDGADHTSGLISRTAGVVNIENVRVSATVTGHAYYGGFIGHGGGSSLSSSKIRMTGCVFDGQLTENTAGETQHVGGFIGWGDYMTITMTDCLFDGTYTIGSGGSGKHNFHPVGYYTATGGISATQSNVYYSAAPSAQNQENNGTVISSDGKMMHSIDSSDDNVLSLGFSGKATEYNVSNITSYEGNKGLKYVKLYAGNGDNVNLTLSHADAEAGQHFTGYTVSGGGSLTAQTETTATLTMGDADQTISAVYADNPSHIVTLAISTEPGWSVEPSGMVREGETVTVSYQGDHKVKSVAANALSGTVGPVTITGTKTGDNTYSGTFTMPAADVGISTDLYYKLSAEVSLQENLYFNGVHQNFYLDRTLTKDVWNTFASPFAIPSEKMEEYFGPGAKVCTFSSSTMEEDNVLCLHFVNATEIKVGSPYIVKPTVNVVEPTFDDANFYNAYMNDVSDTYVCFTPTLGRYELTSYVRDFLIMSNEGKFVHPSTPGTIKGYRCFFMLYGGAKDARAFRVNFGDGEITDIIPIRMENASTTADGTYDLQGRRVNGQPMQRSAEGRLFPQGIKKGVYIHNGRKVVIH